MLQVICVFLYNTYQVLSRISNFSSEPKPFKDHEKYDYDPKKLSLVKLTIFFPPFSGIAPCVETTEVVQMPTLDSALLCISRAGTDLC